MYIGTNVFTTNPINIVIIENRPDKLSMPNTNSIGLLLPNENPVFMVTKIDDMSTSPDAQPINDINVLAQRIYIYVLFF